ncbi:hypothetical protein CPB86DRAFT_814060 [Serendipita vermifera]|nr:hypothetical protein CPB86DRAFT_814060 [Serendipita vermifera]
MALVQYSGHMMAKKKQELQEIAEKLSISTAGTKEEIHARIKSHLDAHDLSEDPVYAGLYPAKRKLARKESTTTSAITKSPTSDDESSLRRKASGRRKATPPLVTSPSEETLTVITAPSSPVRALISTVDAALSNTLPDKQSLVQVAESTGTKLVVRANKAWKTSREFMSNATNIASVTVLLDFLFIMYVMTPWQYYKLPLSQPGSSYPVYVAYPPLDFLLSGYLYKQLFYWAIPTVIAPQLAGNLISFTTPRKDIDPLSSAIVKLALAVILDDSWYAVQGRTISQWRIVGAATSLAFSMAEAVEERRVVTREHHSHT